MSGGSLQYPDPEKRLLAQAAPVLTDSFQLRARSLQRSRHRRWKVRQCVICIQRVSDPEGPSCQALLSLVVEVRHIR